MITHWLGVDTGGTFTDFVYFNGKSIRIHKVLSTPQAPEKAILQGISELAISLEGLQLIHGSTVATNAVLEGKGVKTVYIANRGFADVLTIGRQARRELYNLMPEPREAFIPADCCIEINSRLSAEGELIVALQQSDIDKLINSIEKINPRSIAINLLFSFLDNHQEQEIKKQLTQRFKTIFVCCSSDVLPEYKEYERGMATALNAYVGPLMQGYLQRLSCGLEIETTDNNLLVLQSNGGTIQATQAGEHAVNLLLSGPAGGLMGAQYVAKLSGRSRLLSFDMGGTSTDVALLDGEIKLTSEGCIGDYPVAVPMVDMHTIGAGGGSIAFVDAGGLLNVGPQSAGANPGPACYDQGGEQATVTDANLILGRLQADGFLGKGMRLNIDAARNALQKIASPLNLSIEALAEGIIKIANEHMVRALRTISEQRGFNPADFSLTCFGGAGGLHVCALAEALNMPRAIVPVHGGVLSALGMLVAAPSRELSQSVIQNLNNSETVALEKIFLKLEARGIHEMKNELTAEPVLSRSLDLRYQGQSFTLNLPWYKDIDIIEQDFHQLHKKNYGHELEMPVELVNVRVSIKASIPPFKLPVISMKSKFENPEQIKIVAYDGPMLVYQRDALYSGQTINGPALILETVSTTLVDVNWVCRVDNWGNLLLNHE
jgi:N-methylhydantoinase A